MQSLVLFLAAGALLAQAPSAQAPPAETAGPKSIGTMSELMLDVIFPTSNEIFYVGRNEQKSEKDWRDLQNNALMMGEAANILMAENRARDKDRWMKDAKLLWTVGDKAFKASKARDLEALKDLNDELYEACQSCHEHYRPGYRRRP
jgi:cytochrome c556